MPHDINVLLRDIPEDTDRILNALAFMRGVRKWEVTRDALVEYAKRHKGDLEKLAKGVVK
jgi:hypothetical protein